MAAIKAGPNNENPTLGAFVVDGTVNLQMVWCPTARFIDDQDNSPHSRNSASVYMRGLKEHIIISTNNSTSWRWRRICFTAKGLYQGKGSNSDFIYTSSGVGRLLNQHNNDTLGNLVNAVVFEGNQNQDWTDIFTAKTSSNRVKIMYDKTFTINSSSEGVIRDYKFWHAMNKTLVYDDEEAGKDDTTSGYSTLGRQGMGDYYVIDYIRANTTASAADTISFSPASTLYWHEK